MKKKYIYSVLCTLLFSLVGGNTLHADSTIDLDNRAICINDTSAVENNISSDFDAIDSAGEITTDYFRPYPTLILSYAAGRYISISNNYASVELFSPFISSSSSYSPFVDVQGYCFDNGLWAASLGGGIRKSLAGGQIVGVNAYYDSLQGRSKDFFQQLGLGAEWLTNCFDFRINGYLPISSRRHSYNLCVFDQLGDGFFATSRKNEFSYSGFDAEVGFWIMDACDFQLYAAAGPYYFSKRHFHEFFGGTARAVLSWKSLLSLQVRVTSDRVNSTRVQGLIALEIPLDWFWAPQCRTCDSCCDCLWMRPVQRNGLILTDRCCDWDWNW